MNENAPIQWSAVEVTKRYVRRFGFTETFPDRSLSIFVQAAVDSP
jgi:hypothetical protein